MPLKTDAEIAEIYKAVSQGRNVDIPIDEPDYDGEELIRIAKERVGRDIDQLIEATKRD